MSDTVHFGWRRTGRLAAALTALPLLLAACEGDNLFKTGGVVVVTDPPTVDVLSVPAAAAAGDHIEISIRASGAANIRELQVNFRGAVTQDVTRNVSPAHTPVFDSMLFSIPAEVADSLLIVRVVARDVGGRTSAPVTDTVRVSGFVSASLPHAAGQQLHAGVLHEHVRRYGRRAAS